jgi:hypothetical protein
VKALSSELYAFALGAYVLVVIVQAMDSDLTEKVAAMDDQDLLSWIEDVLTERINEVHGDA